MPSLGYGITDCHLPKGFVSYRKPSTTILCDCVYCDCTNNNSYSNNGSVLSYEHDYHSHCLQRWQFKCLIWLDYFRNEITRNINWWKEFIEEYDDSWNDLDNAEHQYFESKM